MLPNSPSQTLSTSHMMSPQSEVTLTSLFEPGKEQSVDPSVVPLPPLWQRASCRLSAVTLVHVNALSNTPTCTDQRGFPRSAPGGSSDGFKGRLVIRSSMIRAQAASRMLNHEHAVYRRSAAGFFYRVWINTPAQDGRSADRCLLRMFDLESNSFRL